MEFGEQLRLLREARKLTQAQLAERVNLSRAAISLYEAGMREPKRTELRSLADALGVRRTFWEEDERWAEVEEALAQARAILLGTNSTRDSHQPVSNDSEPSAANVAGNHEPATDDFCSRVVSRPRRVLALTR